MHQVSSHTGSHPNRSDRNVVFVTDKPLDRVPELRRPVLIAAFGGWNDAGDAASDTVDHLALTWNASDLYHVEPDDYYDYQASRPMMHQRDGVLRRIEWPSTLISTATVPDSEHDVVLVSGLEPNFRWNAFCQEIVDVALALGVERVIMLGAFTSEGPHTRPVKITGTFDSPEAAAAHGLAKAQYEGAAGVTSVLQSAFTQSGIPAMTLWASVPHYISAPPQPRVTVALLNRLEDELDTTIPMDKLLSEASGWEEAIEDMVSDDEDLAGYIRDLEEHADSEQTLGDEVDGDTLAAEFERYLRRRGRDQGPTGP